jgi:DUF1365 family protein
VTLASALFVGTVRHRRFAVRRHSLAYPLFMLYADLDELPRLFAGSRLWSARRPAVAWLRRADYSLGDPALPWAEAVRAAVGERLGRPLDGPVRLLTHPRTLGFRMNPVSFYWCFDSAGALEAVAAEVTNTPWDERHVYVVDARTAARHGRALLASTPKRFHVSPFLPMEAVYRWRLVPPGERLLVHMENVLGGERAFDATLTLSRREIDPRSLRRALLGHPAMTLRICLWIYLHAAWLLLRKVPFHPHPAARPTTANGDGAALPPVA